MRADKIERRYEIFWQLLRSECPDLAAHLSGSLSSFRALMHPRMSRILTARWHTNAWRVGW
jgi:hypothetical protein